MESIASEDGNGSGGDVEQASGDNVIPCHRDVLPQKKREASLHICRRRWPVEPFGSGGHPPGYLGRGGHSRKQLCLLIPPGPQDRCPANVHRFNLMARVQARAAQSEALVRQLRQCIALRK